MKRALKHYIKLIFGIIIGFFATAFNLHAAVENKTLTADEIVNFHLVFLNTFAGFIVAIMTIYYLYWQVKKIKKELKKDKEDD